MTSGHAAVFQISGLLSGAEGMTKKMFKKKDVGSAQPALIIGLLCVALLILYREVSIGEGGGDEVSVSRTGAFVVVGEAHVIDGDTLRIAGTTKVRLSGLAAPERNEPGGAAATQFMREKLTGRNVRCELSGESTYDRQVGTCYLESVDVAEMIVSAGLARDCPRYSGGRYARFEGEDARNLPFPDYCRLR